LNGGDTSETISGLGAVLGLLKVSRDPYCINSWVISCVFRTLAFSRATKGSQALLRMIAFTPPPGTRWSRRHSPALYQRRTWVARLVVEQPGGFKGKGVSQQIDPWKRSVQYRRPFLRIIFSD
jgi:hypothetical protein